ncbi:MAG: hypothetical protein EA399_02150 [Desulfovibrionales bacterium]|nr:MAG: hypothetical protein EA399_02150 [Desulfovibrionales bacterium]
MQKIPLKLAAPGMKLAKPILRDNGLVLVAEETELSESLLERLERMDVAMVTVQGNPVNLGGTETNPYTERAKRLEHLFRKQAEDPWMIQLRTHLHDYFQLKAASAPMDMEQTSQAEPGGTA